MSSSVAFPRATSRYTSGSSMLGRPELQSAPAVEPGRGVVRLRDVVAADVPVFFAHQCDPLAVHMAAFAPRSEKDFAIHWQQILANRDVVRKTIVHRHSVAGNLVSFEQSGRTLVGYWLGREHWG